MNLSSAGGQPQISREDGPGGGEASWSRQYFPRSKDRISLLSLVNFNQQSPGSNFETEPDPV
jgi:hypothetical protein